MKASAAVLRLHRAVWHIQLVSLDSRGFRIDPLAVAPQGRNDLLRDYRSSNDLSLKARESAPQGSSPDGESVRVRSEVSRRGNVTGGGRESSFRGLQKG